MFKFYYLIFRLILSLASSDTCPAPRSEAEVSVQGNSGAVVLLEVPVLPPPQHAASSAVLQTNSPLISSPNTRI